jgi:hypothetical protein
MRSLVAEDPWNSASRTITPPTVQSIWCVVVDPTEPLGWNPEVEGGQDVGLKATDTCRHQRGDVPSAAVFAEKGCCVKQLGYRFLGHGERTQRGIHRAPLDSSAESRDGQQLRGADERAGVDEITEDALQRPHAALLSGRRSRPQAW